jgi:hypothetical protein
VRESSRCCCALPAYGVFTLSAGAASAQINPFTGKDLLLSESDAAVIEEVVGGLISGTVAPTGTKLHWYNGETHRRGTIEVLASSQHARCKEWRRCRAGFAQGRSAVIQGSAACRGNSIARLSVRRARRRPERSA